MKKIGIIGGMSWESSLQYYKIANEMVKQKLGGFHSCRCILASVDFAEIEELQHKGNWQELTERMIDEALNLQNAGADLIIIATNTMHIMASAVEAAIQIPLLHIADAAANAVKKLNLSKVALLGTRFTMEQNFYKDRIVNKHQIDVLIPDKAERDIIHDIIYRELVMGLVRKDSEKIFIEIINRLALDGAQGVILGCTEIPMLVNNSNSPIPVFDTTFLHVQMAVNDALYGLI